MPPKDKYANPELRDQIKKEIHESDKGGAPGQWSARKAQMMAKEYKDRGGEYNTDPKDKDESQQNLTNWGEEEWQTKEGSGHAKKEDGTEKRYLPKKAWEQMSEKEKEETDQKKQEGSKEGKQHVSNTPKAKSKRKEASKENDKSNDKIDNEDDEDENDEDDFVEDDEEDEEPGEDDGDFEEGDAQDDEEAESEVEGEGEENDDEEDTKAGDKRKAKGQSNGTTKKQKSNAPEGKVGSKHMDDKEPAPRGSADRLPKKGQKITWKAMPGFVEGKVTQVLTEGKTVDGKSVKASKDDPKIIMESSSSGKICVHKPDACFYD